MASLAVAAKSTDNPIQARLAPDRKTNDGESVRARLTPDRKTDNGEPVRAGLAPAHDGDGDIVRAELASDQIETDDREGRPDEYNGVGKEGDRKGRPNESDRKITLGEIVGAYKSLVFNNCLKLAKDRGEYLGKFWQRDYYENIIRNDEAFIKISEYIINNPAKWRDDKFYTK